MKAVFVLLLAAVLCAEQADSLWCYTCENQSSNWGCLRPTRCADADKYCLTSVGSAGLGIWSLRKKITKKCSPTCPQFDVNLGIASYATTCCESFLCNLGAKPGPKAALQ